MRTFSWLGLGIALAAGWSAPARGEAPKAFAQLRDRAKPVEGLGPFLSDFVGGCGADPIDGKACREKVDRFRKASLGNLYYALLDDGAQQMVRPKSFNPQTHQLVFALTPYFEADGLALSEGQPKRQDAQGRPLLPLMRLAAVLGDEVTPMDVDRLFRTGNVRMQIVFKPLGLWRLPRKDRRGAYLEGVKAKIVGVRLSDAQSGSEIASLVTAR